MSDKINEGEEILDFLFGAEAATGLYQFLEKSKKGFGEYLLYSCGEFYSDPTLNLKTKQLIVITALITQKGAFPQLKNHLMGCKHAGLSKEEVVASIIHLTMYIGFPTVVNALEVVDEVFAKA